MDNFKKGSIFTFDRFKDGDVKEYKCVRICKRFITAKSLDGKEHFNLPYHRLKEITFIK